MNVLIINMSILKSAETILDLGCGNGVDTLALKKLGIRTVACDFSHRALVRIQEIEPDIETLCFDMTSVFPFDDKSFDVVISDLSLHYFSTNITRKICNEIERILKRGGVLICRINSIEEYSPQDTDIELEDNYYLVDGHSRRYFNVSDVMEQFNMFTISSLSKHTIKKYNAKKRKSIIEFLATKRF